MYCRNCGKKINENAVVCLHCGCELSPKETTNNKKQINKGKGIASMVLSIIAFLFCFLVSFFIVDYVSYVSSYHYDYYGYRSYNNSPFALMVLLIAIYCFTILSIVGLCLAIFERKHNKNVFNTIGFWLNLIVIIIAVIHILCCIFPR